MLIKYTIGLAALTGQLSANYCLGKEDPTGLEYNGTMAVSKYGLPCQNWAEIQEYFTETGENEILNVDRILFNHNYCRNPLNSITSDVNMDEPWCWVAYKGSPGSYFSRESCGIRTCKQFEFAKSLEITKNKASSVLSKKAKKRVDSWDYESPWHQARMRETNRRNREYREEQREMRYKRPYKKVEKTNIK